MIPPTRTHWPALILLVGSVACATFVAAQTGSAGASPRAGERAAPGMGSGTMPMQPGGGMGPGMGPGMGRGMGMNMPGFSDFDADNDGRISQSELNAVRSERRSQRAAQGYPMRGAANAPSFSDLDTDGSGGISREEFSRFHRLGGSPAGSGR